MRFEIVDTINEERILWKEVARILCEAEFFEFENNFTLQNNHVLAQRGPYSS